MLKAESSIGIDGPWSANPCHAFQKVPPSPFTEGSSSCTYLSSPELVQSVPLKGRSDLLSSLNRTTHSSLLKVPPQQMECFQITANPGGGILDKKRGQKNGLLRCPTNSSSRPDSSNRVIRSSPSHSERQFVIRTPDSDDSPHPQEATEVRLFNSLLIPQLIFHCSHCHKCNQNEHHCR